jgi:hypothetical protein
MAMVMLPMTSARCERTTPLGRPVVPEVYMIKRGIVPVDRHPGFNGLACGHKVVETDFARS